MGFQDKEWTEEEWQAYMLAAVGCCDADWEPEMKPWDCDWEPEMKSNPEWNEGGGETAESQLASAGAGEDFVYGLFWDPVNNEHVELGGLTGPIFNQDGGWTAKFVDFNDKHYSLTCFGSNVAGTQTEIPKREAGVTSKEPKIVYQPVQKDGIEDFCEHAWPSASGLPSPAAGEKSPVRSAGSDGSSDLPSNWEGPKSVVAGELRCALGSKPQGNKNALEAKILTGMTLSEHITHVQYYSSPAQFKAKIPDDIPEQLWNELVEIFIGYHAYNIEDPEVVIWKLKKMYAEQFLVQPPFDWGFFPRFRTKHFSGDLQNSLPIHLRLGVAVGPRVYTDPKNLEWNEAAQIQLMEINNYWF